jgi:hypothetical protein
MTIGKIRFYDCQAFEQEFPNVVETARNIDFQLKNNSKICYILISAQVKSGKRRVKQYLALRNRETIGLTPIKHLYITKLSNLDIRFQMEEYLKYGIFPLQIHNRNYIKKAIKIVENNKKHGCQTWIHFDESDYGTGSKQLLKDFFFAIKEQNVKVLYYSATNAELEFSDFFTRNNENFITTELIPGIDYHGATYYLNAGLVHEATDFFDIKNNKLTLQAINLLEDFSKDDKIFGIVRFTLKNRYKAIKNEIYSAHLEFKKQVEKFGILIRFIDKDNSFKWGDEIENEWSWYVTQKQKVLLVLCQTCGRSTEIKFQPYISFWHDFRNGHCSYNTRIQAYLRSAYYGKENHQLKIYANIPTFQLHAGQISYEEYIKQTGFPLSSRVNSSTRNKYLNEIIVVPALTDEKAKEWIRKNLNKKSTVSSINCNNKIDYADCILSKNDRSSSKTIQRIIYIDEASPKFPNSFDDLQTEYPEYIGKYVCIIKKEDALIRTNIKSMYHK